MDNLRDAMLSLFASAGVAQGSAVYVSTPITTGKHFARWHATNAGLGRSHYKEKLHADIVSPNLIAAEPLVAEVRRRWPSVPVIDPTKLKDVPSWSQPDYHGFWCDVIESYANQVVFADGWSFSNGCALEFEAALRSGIRTYDHTMHALDRTTGITLLSTAVADLDHAGYDSTTIAGVLARLSARPRISVTS